MAVTQRTTIYLAPKVYRALKIKAALTDRGISDLISEAVELALREDAADRKALRRRGKERARPFAAFLRELKRDGLL